ncbi:hypothetical protein BJ165DRAFT_1464001 [Panaeolus papilionaceus]|nr:hypothetical protein BJ165DRAFT_1464001 [Panaeolus papilionaceus]
MWNGLFFEKSSLRDIGVRLQLNHKFRDPCIGRKKAKNDEFCIIDITGIHLVSVDFCQCGVGDQSPVTQLLRAGLFPATVTQPQTAATFDALNMFEMLSYESKISGFEFYQTLSRLTCNTGLSVPPDRYVPFLRMIHEWRHLHMAVRCGRGHDVLGIKATREGEFAILCAACPHPGKNLSPEKSNKWYLNATFLALDANFRLKRKNVSNNVLDPGLSKGWAYFVEDTAYRVHVKKYEKEKEVKSTCSRHDAVNLSNTKPNQGHAASGVGKVVCARHDMNLPNAFADLQLGEKYANMDYVFYKCISTLERNYSYIVSYDVACQWSINLPVRLRAIQEDFFFPKDIKLVKYLVPKFHLPAHIAPCRIRYSFQLASGVGRTDGEAPERLWNETNPLATSTREMGPGTRRDTLDYHFGDFNWKKTITFGRTMKRKLHVAAIDMAEHVIEFNDLCQTIDPKLISGWLVEVLKWEDDPVNAPNPYEIIEDGPSQASVRRQLAEAEALDLAAGIKKSLDEEVSPSVLISRGIDLEAEQRLLKTQSKEVWEHAQDRQITRLQLNMNALQRKIDNWVPVQSKYCPAVIDLREAEKSKEGNGDEKVRQISPVDYKLWLPSQIGRRGVVDQELREVEWKNREGQAFEALKELRHELQLRVYVKNFKDRFSRGQGANTRAKNTQDIIEKRVNAAASKYRAAHQALQNLAEFIYPDNHEWKKKLRVLTPADVRHISEAALGESLGKKTISWIWTHQSGHVGATNDEPNIEHVKAEWARCRARAARFIEEVELLVEEMNRILRFFAFLASEWDTRANLDGWGALEPATREALVAYAKKTASMYRQLEKSCRSKWSDLPAHVTRMSNIIKTPSLVDKKDFAASSSSMARVRERRRAGLGKEFVDGMEVDAGEGSDEGGNQGKGNMDIDG